MYFSIFNIVLIFLNMNTLIMIVQQYPAQIGVVTIHIIVHTCLDNMD